LNSISYIGEISALMTAVFWALAVILFRISGLKVSPISLNLLKNSIALVLLFITVFCFGIPIFPNARLTEILFLLLSGLVGLGIADTLWLASINILGAGSVAIVECLYSPFVILSAFLLLGETMTWLQSLGGILIISSLLFLFSERRAIGLPMPTLVKGLSLGTLSMALMSISIVGVKPILESYSVVWSSMVRMVGGVIGLVLFSLFYKNGREFRNVFRLHLPWKTILAASILGPYLSCLFWIAGFKYMQANLASLLNQLSTVFIVILATVFLKETMTRPKAFAVFFALIGSFFVLYST